MADEKTIDAALASLRDYRGYLIGVLAKDDMPSRETLDDFLKVQSVIACLRELKEGREGWAPLLSKPDAG
jgi:hypothetical protein